MKWEVPFFDLDLGEEEKQAAISVIESNWLTSGPRTEQFESAFTEKYGDDIGAVAVSSATAALHLSLLALDIGPGDEVILPSLTFVACANVVRYLGATPVFADISSEENWNISPADVALKVTTRTRAVMIVHYAGYPCDMGAFTQLCEQHGLHMIEDCSHAPLGKWRGRPLGTFGDTGCFSFHSNKNMTTGEGGMLISRDQDIVDRARKLRSHGITTSTYQRFQGHRHGYDVVEVGYNYRIDEIRAGIGIVQLNKLPSQNRKRKVLVEQYRELVAEELPGVAVPFKECDDESSYHIFPVLLPGDETLRDRALQNMAERGIQCSVHYHPIHRFTAYKGIVTTVPLTDQIAGSLLTLPLYPSLTTGKMELVVKELKACLP
ncbi:MAG: hypothetical protein AMJ68_05365 [Acidithiobacillales bacterium SG8_45]|nr:MAG: hypothetical protein AMJ68_05365 [Acidithiobacillales bacterium SG8_45]